MVDTAGRRVSRLLGAGVAASGLLLAAGLMAPAGRRDSLLRAGILLLIFTPVARVALLAGTFALRKEWRMFLVSAGVLGLLGGGILLGK